MTTTIKAEALVLVGTYDFIICPPVWARQMHAEIPASHLVEFKDSGHFPHLEEPEKSLQRVRAFVSEVSKDH